MKPAIATMEEFKIVDQGVRLFENGEWCDKNQKDIPLPIIKIVDELDMLGVKLASKYATTRASMVKS